MYPHPEFAHRIAAQRTEEARRDAERARFVREHTEQVAPHRGLLARLRRPVAARAVAARGCECATV